MEKQELNFKGSGWSFPVTFSAGNYELNLSRHKDNINQAIHIILQTRNGERCMEPQFGPGLQQFFFRKMDETLRGEMTDAIKMSLLINEPRITVKDVQVYYTDLKNGVVEIHVAYVHNQTNSRHNFVFPFNISEGTNLPK